jgi:hypothetical protein
LLYSVKQRKKEMGKNVQWKRKEREIDEKEQRSD